MVKVAVVGGGIAGMAAAESAAAAGAAVRLYEAAGSLQPSTRELLSLLSGGSLLGMEPEERNLEELGVSLAVNKEVLQVEGDGTVLTRADSARFDQVVVATGRRVARDSPSLGSRKGSYLLSDSHSFRHLGANVARHSKILVSGSGQLAVEVASILSARKATVCLLAPGGLMAGELEPVPRARARRAAAEAGVQLMDAPLGRVVGVESVEAAMVGGDLVPCDGIVVAPTMVPSPVKSTYALGRDGGVVVDQAMKSTSPRLLAAGGCSEVRVGSGTLRVGSEASSAVMGSAAGTNAAGGRVFPRLTNIVMMSAFGIDVVVAGISSWQASSCGLDCVAESAETLESACSLVIERGGGTILGAQLAGPKAGEMAEVLGTIVGGRLGLSDFVYSDALTAADASLISETARRGMKRMTG